MPQNDDDTNHQQQTKILAELGAAITEFYPEHAFVLMILPNHPGENLNYLSNAHRKEVIQLLKEFVASQEQLPPGSNDRSNLH